MSRAQRRQFLLAAGALLAAPLARAQQQGRRPVIGYLIADSPEPVFGYNR